MATVESMEIFSSGGTPDQPAITKRFLRMAGFAPRPESAIVNIVFGMTRNAGIAQIHRILQAGSMTIRARQALMRIEQGKIRRPMIEAPSLPVARVVAGLALADKDILVALAACVTLFAFKPNGFEALVRVAHLARQNPVQARQGKIGEVVIEEGIFPFGCYQMAIVALFPARPLMNIIFLMTVDACITFPGTGDRSCRFVARDACQGIMATLYLKRRVPVMIEARISPCLFGVAIEALRSVRTLVNIVRTVTRHTNTFHHLLTDKERVQIGTGRVVARLACDVGMMTV